nr:nodulation-signaling pathway 1 protein [Oryza sativa Japonica Group]
MAAGVGRLRRPLPPSSRLRSDLADAIHCLDPHGFAPTTLTPSTSAWHVDARGAVTLHTNRAAPTSAGDTAAMQRSATSTKTRGMGKRKEPYAPKMQGICGGGYAWWWAASPAAQQDDIGSVVAQTLSPPSTAAPAAASPSIASPAASSPSDVPSSSSKKRKSPAHRAPGHTGGKKGGGGKGGGGGSDRDMRWAEQLLNPCAVAVEAGNLSRVQHLFYVLGELESFSGDANHRLAAHGLRALARWLPAAVGPAAAAAVRVPPCSERPTTAFAAAEPRLFRASLIRFHEVSPWFALPNALANAAIAQASTCGAAGATPRPLHVVDLGVSHGVQWPTLLESLTRQPGGRAPPSVRLTVVGPGATATSPVAPFSASPPGYDFSPHLLRYAKSINLDLRISRAATLDDAVPGDDGEALVVCLQFRLGHAAAEERREVLRKARGLNPELVVLSELDSGVGVVGGDGGSAAGEFAARLELLWRFLESTSAAFKGKDVEERRLLEDFHAIQAID